MITDNKEVLLDKSNSLEITQLSFDEIKQKRNKRKQGKKENE